MKRNLILAATATVATLFGSATMADSHAGHHAQAGSEGGSGMAMHGSGQGMAGKSGMMDMMHRMHGGGMMRGGMMGGGQTAGGMMQMFDTDDDGTVTSEELRTGLDVKLAEYDADGNGALSIAEFETLHSAMIREMTVDRFQELDADGDGSVTAEEMTATADKMARMENMRSQMSEMQNQSGDGMGQSGNGMPMNGDAPTTGN